MLKYWKFRGRRISTSQLNLNSEFQTIGTRYGDSVSKKGKKISPETKHKARVLAKEPNALSSILGPMG